MQSRAEKDAKTLLVVRALAVFALVLIAGGLLVVVADRLGVDALDPAVRVLTGVAVLGAVGFLLRRG